MNRKTILKPKLPPKRAVKIIGLGGVGSIAARYGAVFLASLQRDCTLTLVDGDSFEPSNASRMLFGDCSNKALVVREEMLPRFKYSKLTILARREYVDAENIKDIIRPGDTVLLCVDNHVTRKLVSDHCAKLKNICLISGGNDGVGDGKRGTYGNAQIYVRRKGRNVTCSLTKYHPEIDQPKDKHPEEKNCTDLVVSVPQILFANLAVASAMLNTLLLYVSGQTHYAELSFDIAEGLMRPTIKV